MKKNEEIKAGDKLIIKNGVNKGLEVECIWTSTSGYFIGIKGHIKDGRKPGGYRETMPVTKNHVKRIN